MYWPVEVTYTDSVTFATELVASTLSCLFETVYSARLIETTSGTGVGVAVRVGVGGRSVAVAVVVLSNFKLNPFEPSPVEAAVEASVKDHVMCERLGQVQKTL